MHTSCSVYCSVCIALCTLLYISCSVHIALHIMLCTPVHIALHTWVAERKKRAKCIGSNSRLNLAGPEAHSNHTHAAIPHTLQSHTHSHPGSSQLLLAISTKRPEGCMVHAECYGCATSQPTKAPKPQAAEQAAGQAVGGVRRKVLSPEADK